jgi:PucR C-terminal helix-turn-helix domain/GGDEF-like domain
MSVEQIQALVDGLATRLGRAVLVDDRDLRLVAASQDFGDADPARVWSLLHRRTRPEDVRHDEITRLPGPGYVPENPELELRQRLCVPIRCQGLLLGFVWITDRFGEIPQEEVADAAATAAEIGVLLRDRLVAADRDRVLHRDLVERLLGRDAAARSEASAEAVDRGLPDEGGKVAVLLVRRATTSAAAPGESPAGASPAVFLPDIERLSRDHPGLRALSACWPRRAVAIVTGWPGECLDRSVRALADELGKAGPWRVGVGGPVPGLAELPAAKRQADIALSTLSDSGVACWTGLSADGLLAQFPRQLWTDALLPAGLARLLADPAAPVLLSTLSTFLDCAGEAQRTAAQLRVHRTTLYYRLNRIEQISGLSLRDGRDRLLAHLALRLHHLYGTPALPTDVEEPARNPQRNAG